MLDRLFPTPDPYAADCPLWAKDKLGIHLWSKQRDICHSVVENRYTAVHSGHGVGKTLDAGVIACHWLETKPIGSAFVVTTAPTDTQVKAILWREIGKAHRKGELRGRITLDAQWYIGQELVAYGRKPADYVDPEQAKAAFQGIHARHVLVILDEAAGIPAWLWEAVDSLATNEFARVLAIGNPDDPASEFAKKCAPGSGWNVIHISVFDSPNFTGEPIPPGLEHDLTGPTWVEERKNDWGEESPLYISKVLGLFPSVSDDTLIHPGWVREAQERELPGVGPGRYALDVADSGKDEAVLGRNRDGVFRVVKAKSGVNDTMVLAGWIHEAIERHKGIVAAVVDIIGLGKGPYDRAAEQGLAVIGFNAAHRSSEPERFKNRRAEQWWNVRELFRKGLIDIDPLDLKLASQLQSIKWKTNSSGQIVIESKADMAKRGLPSPDRGDTLMMSCVEDDVQLSELADIDPDTNMITAGVMTRQW